MKAFNFSETILVRWAAWTGCCGVALGAFGAHGLEPHLVALDTVETWETAVQYHLVHAVALLALGLASLSRPLSRLRTVATCWLFGVAVFSGMLYLYSVTGVRWLGAIVPVGGVGLLAGWAVLGICVRPLK